MIRLRYGVPWVLAASAAALHGSGKRELVLKLQHVRIEEVLPIVEKELRPDRAEPAPWDSKLDRAANTATFWGSADVLRRIIDLIERLDVPRGRAS